MARQKLAPAQVAAIKWGRELGERIAKEYPCIAASYAAGWRREDIAAEYGFEEKYGIPAKTATDAVGYALSILIPEDRLRRIGAEHRLAAQEQSGLAAKERGDGIFSLPRRKLSMNGAKGAREIMRRRLGIFGPGYKRGATEGQIRARGLVPWTTEQRRYFVMLKEEGLSYRQIACKLFEKFGVLREPAYLGPYFYRMIKKGGKT